MPRTITVTLQDGTKHVYRNAPDNITPQAVQARAQREFGMGVTALDGGRSAPALGSPEAYAARWQGVSPAAAKALVQRYAATAQRGGTAPEDFAKNPQVAGLMKVAGMTSISLPQPTKDQRIASAAKAAANAPGNDPGFFTAMKAGLIRTAGFGIPERLAAAGERYLPSAITGNTTNASYDDILKAVRAKTDAEAAQSGTGNFIGSLLGGGLTGSAAGGAVGAVAGRAASAAPALARVASTIAAAAPKTTAAARIIGAGAAGGATQAAGEGSDVGEGATTGAVSAGAFGAGAKALKPILQRAGDFLGTSSAASVLRRFTSETAESMKAKLDDFRARTGTEPTVFELLNAGDRQSLRKAVGLMPDAQRENLAANVRARAAAVGPDLRGRVAAVTGDAQDTRAANLAQQLAESRGGPGTAPTPEDTALGASAVRSPLDMDTVRRTVNRNIMAPHDDTVLYPDMNPLHPQHPELQPDNSVRMVRSDPDISTMLSKVAGTAARRSDGITGSDVSAMLSKLGKIRDGNNGTESATAGSAIDHLTDLLSTDHPQFADAQARMQAANAANRRIMEGMDEGARTRVRADAPATRAARNAYDTPEGSEGRASGQAAELERNVSGTPEQALSAARAIGSSPGQQAAISANLGGNAGGEIADSAAGVSESARRLAGLSNEGTDNSADPVAMLHGLMGLSPATLPHTKLFALARLGKLQPQLPANASQGIVDALFSQNPTQIARAMTMLNNAGDAGKAVLSDISRGIATGAATTALDQPAPQTDDPEPFVPGTSHTDANGGLVVDVQPQAVDQPAPSDGPAAPVDVANSPYLDHLQSVYASENPDLLDLSDRIQHQESGGHQHDANGNPIVSKAGAIGTMQIMPGTAGDAAKAAGLPLDMAALSHDPVYNKALGIAHLGALLKHYKGDPVKAVAAYNAGAGTVDKALAGGGDWIARLPAETQDYVQKVS